MSRETSEKDCFVKSKILFCFFLDYYFIRNSRDFTCKYRKSYRLIDLKSTKIRQFLTYEGYIINFLLKQCKKKQIIDSSSHKYRIYNTI